MKHPNQSLLNDYALGSQDKTMRLLVETHLGLCSECEGKVKAIRSENLVEVAIETTPNLGVPRDLFSLILDKISDDKPEIENSIIPEFLKVEVEEESDWTWAPMWPAKGKIGTILSDDVSGYSIYLVYFEAGEKAPQHKHLDDEFTVILQGGYKYDDTQLGVGDWDVAEKDSTHSPRIEKGCDCWCVVRAKTKKSVSFKGIDSWRTPFVSWSDFINK
jgi:putative transcriptional regulator